jgi:hypothetical protein
MVQDVVGRVSRRSDNLMIWADILTPEMGPFARASHDASELRELLVNTAHLPKLCEGHRNTF